MASSVCFSSSGLDGAPDHTIADVQILVGEEIAEVDDLPPLGD